MHKYYCAMKLSCENNHHKQANCLKFKNKKGQFVLSVVFLLEALVNNTYSNKS